MGLSEIVIRVCAGPAGCHLEPSMFIGWQRINLTRESINMSAILHRELLNPCLSKRTNMEATDALCLLSRPPGARGIFKDQACRYITRGGDWALPLKMQGCRPSRTPGGKGRSQARWVLWLNSQAEEHTAFWDDVKVHSDNGRMMGRVSSGSPWLSTRRLSPQCQDSCGETADSQGAPAERMEPAEDGQG